MTWIPIEPQAIQQSKWSNKVWVQLGDSITQQDGTVYNGTTDIAKGYQTWINAKVGFKEMRNFGVSGQPMTGDGATSTVIFGKSKNYADVDLVTIFAATNDFTLNKPLGVLGESNDTTFDTQTFYGAYRSLIEDIHTKNPKTIIHLWTPLYRYGVSSYGVQYANALGLKLIDYVNAIKAIGVLYCLPVLDLYSLSGINRVNRLTYLRDGLHPNDLGYEKISKIALPFMESN